MNDEINYKNNPLNSIGLKKMLTELTDHYGFDILYAYLNINCFKNNPSVVSSVKFLKKTVWAREKVESFYMYTFKSLPKPSYQQSKLPPRDRIVPDDHVVGEPAALSLEDAEQLREEREIKAQEFDSKAGNSKFKKDVPHNLQNNSLDTNGSAHESNESSTTLSRTASTADNPWGLPKTQ